MERAGSWGGYSYGSLAAIIVVGAFGGWYLTNLQGALYIDEVFYARTGWGLLTGNPYENPTHAIAPTAKYFIGFGQQLFGRTSFGVRVFVALAGVGTLGLTYRLGELVDDRRIGLLAVVLLGSTYAFATQAVRGMLDVPLAFTFVASVHLALRWRRDDWRLAAPLFGVAAVAVVTTKVYGFIYVFTPLVVVGGVVARRWRRRAALTGLRSMLTSAALTVALLFTPYYVVSHPPLTESYGSSSLMALARTLLDVPILGNFVYIGGAALVQNVLHLDSGHAVVVGNTVYQYAPFWSYGYWLLEYGGVLYGVLVVAVLGGVVADAVTNRLTEATILGVATLVPLVVLSALTVKFPRYILPLFPLLLVGGLSYVRRLVGILLARWETLTPRAGRHVEVGGTCVVVLLVLTAGVAVSSSAVAGSMTDSIHADSGYDEAAAFATAYAKENPNEEVGIVVHHNVTFSYYFERRDNVDEMDLRAPQIRNDDAFRGMLERRLCRGEIDLVIDKQHNKRVEGLFVGQFVREHSTVALRSSRSPGDEALVVYEMDDVASTTPQPAGCRRATANRTSARPTL